MGVNMPARTALFESVRKHDGTRLRDLLPSEYIQMAGRAGRRGLDSTGTVIVLCTRGTLPDMSDFHRMMMGKPSLLQSQFRLTYSMILNLLRVRKLRVEDMMKRSFSEFHSQTVALSRQRGLASLEARVSRQDPIAHCSLCSQDLGVYYDNLRLWTELQSSTMAKLCSSNAKCLSPGRLLLVYSASRCRLLLSAVLRRNKPGTAPADKSADPKTTFTVFLIFDDQQPVPETSPSSNTSSQFLPTSSQFSLPVPENVAHKLAEISLPHSFSSSTAATAGSDEVDLTLVALLAKSVKMTTPDRIVEDLKKRQQPRFRKTEPADCTERLVNELKRYLVSNAGAKLPTLDLVQQAPLKDLGSAERVWQMTSLLDKCSHYKCTSCCSLAQHFELMSAHKKSVAEVEAAKYLASDSSLGLIDEYNQKLQVLQRLDYIDAAFMVKLKGRVALELATQELLCTELLLDGMLAELSPPQIAGLLSCLVLEQKRASPPQISCSKLAQAVSRMFEIADKLVRVQTDCGVMVGAADDISSQLHVGLVEVVFQWAQGKPFVELTCLTDIQEGIIVRSIQRLDELLRDVKDATRLVGDPTIGEKMAEVSQLIRRDVVFVASLYTD